MTSYGPGEWMPGPRPRATRSYLWCDRCGVVVPGVREMLSQIIFALDVSEKLERLAKPKGEEDEADSA